VAQKDVGIHRRYKAGPKGRKSIRIAIQVTVEIGGHKGAAIGKALDITPEGVLVRAPHSYGVGERVALTLRVPKFAQRFDFAAEVKWLEPAGSMKEFYIGCLFVHTAESKRLIDLLVWELATGNIPEALRVHKRTTRRHVR
jgi:hypothetical protein